MVAESAEKCDLHRYAIAKGITDAMACVTE
jgi:hypothetical protein